jgi:hypothetical protein
MSRTYRHTPETLDDLAHLAEPLMVERDGWLYPTGRTISPYDMSQAIADALPALAEALASFIADAGRQ